ncbi:carbohydrate ABC transporter permease [Hamadaea tsunoensis]|uniref:carbohydrate ABC transporter permease n=1 Tax=Hamadaea tsunoensis TaxID=53368 RepID=UPI00041FD1BE|nr:sugar ABC transporter permease [Hamadaea tsunoensis]
MRHGRLPFILGFLWFPVLLYLVYVIWPYCQTVYYSLTDWNGFTPNVPYTGFGNYADLLKDDTFVRSLFHNAVILVVYPIITILLALFFAFMLNVGGRGDRAGIRGVAGSGLYKTIFFFPQLLSIAIVAILWGRIFESSTDTGFLNAVLAKIGIVDPAHPLLFLGETNSWLLPAIPFRDTVLDAPVVLWCLIAIAVWGGVGFYLVLFSAGMQAIPKDLFEAALLDGSSRYQTFFKITLPLLWEQISVAWVYLGIAALDFFLLAFAIAPPSMQATGASHVMSSWVFFTAFGSSRYDKFGYACAMAVAMAAFTFILALVQLRITRREKIEF